MAGAGGTIVLTFVAVALFVRREFEFTVRSIGLFRFSSLAVLGIRVVALGVLILTVCAGLFGVQDAYRNLITTMVWIVWWVGLAFACALVGDAWALANPFALLPARQRRPYPPALGAWPATVLFLGFAWAELVWRDNDVPAYLAWVIVGYALVMLAGALAFGRERWLAGGEAFSLAFGVLGRFAPLHAHHGELRVRMPGAGLVSAEPVHPSLAVFVLLMLSTVTFDGFAETPLMRSLETAVQTSPALSAALFRLSEWGLDESQLVASVALAAFPVAFVGAFWLVAWAMVRLSGSNGGVTQTACAFVLTLVPIAVAYHLAHYFSLLLTAGQFIIPLASDPYGFGWNLFGTARYRVDLGLVSPYVFWYGAVMLILAGHVIAVLLAHSAARRCFGERATVSELPMVTLMVAYTMLSLWILAQPVVG